MTWIAPTVDRARSPRLLDERACLQGWITFQRETLLGKCEGLTHEQLATRSVPPSRLTLLGIVRHMAEVEAWWFRTFLTGEHAHGFFGDDDDDFEKLDSIPAEEVFAVYAEQCRLADETAAGVSLEQRFPNPWDNAAAGELDVRWVYLHMIEEYARHNGHADLLRELLDGTTGD